MSPELEILGAMQLEPFEASTGLTAGRRSKIQPVARKGSQRDEDRPNAEGRLRRLRDRGTAPLTSSDAKLLALPHAHLHEDSEKMSDGPLVHALWRAVTGPKGVYNVV